MVASPREAHGLAGIQALAGERLGPTAWYAIEQGRIDAFAAATDDHQWIHVDPERAAAGPFGATVAHGFLTLSMASAWLDELLTVHDISMAVNYGLDRVRFPSPLPAGSRVRLSALIRTVKEVAGGAQLAAELTWELEGAPKPVCVAEFLFRYYQ